MNKFEYINRNLDSIKFEIQIGIVSSTILRHWEIYSRLDYYMRKRGKPVLISVIYVSDELNISERKVFEIKKEMEEII
jgi:hypothetical protein